MPTLVENTYSEVTLSLATAAPSRPRPGGGRLFIFIGLILALLAAGGVYLFGSLGGGHGGNASTVETVVAKQAIGLRHAISLDDLDFAPVSNNVVNVYTKKSDLVGLIAEIQISKGSIITSDMLARDIGLVSAGSAPAYLPLASGYVALTIPTSEQAGVAGHITLGDYITVIASGAMSVFPKGGGKAINGTVSKTVFVNVRIIGLGPATANLQPAGGATSVGGTQAANGGVTSSLTIEITQCDAEYMTWFLNNMQVKYSLESFADYLKAPPSAPDPTCQDVNAAHGVSLRQVDQRYHFSDLA
jgi:Flp pilus assembly protein CpaB